MVEFTVHDENTAPEEVVPALQKLSRRFGFLPNFYGVMAESPQALAAYQAVSEQFLASSLPTDAKMIVWLAVSRQNECHYCMAVHSAAAERAGVDGQAIDAVRQDKPIEDERLEAVRRFTESVVANQGNVPEEDTQRFLAAGFAQRQILDVLTGVSMKTLSNYANHFAHTPLDDAFTAYEWQA